MKIHLKGAKKTGSPYELRINCPSCDDTQHHCYVNVLKGVYHCFRCQSSGRISQIREAENDLARFYKKVEQFFKPTEEVEPPIELPGEFSKLYGPVKKQSILRNSAMEYLTQRGFYEYEIKKYQLGYCEKGYFAKRIIIPAIFEGKLEYFLARAFVPAIEPKYLNPRVHKKSILFYTEQRPTKSAVICEGALDAISIARVHPAIALLGKELSSEQMKRIISSVETAIVMIDPDAYKYAVSVWMRLREYIPCKLIDNSKMSKDPGDMSPEEIKEALQCESSPIVSKQPKK